MTVQHSFFLHGGPGLNSRAEAETLEPHFLQAGVHTRFWNEPELNGSESAYQELVDLAASDFLDEVRRRGRAVHLIAHSFGANVALDIARRHPEAVAGLLLIAPAFGLDRVQANLVGIARSDFAKLDPQRLQALESAWNASRRFFDAEMCLAVELTASDPELFGHYWANPRQMEKFFSIWTRLGLSMNLRNYFAVMKSFALRDIQSLPAAIPHMAVFGALDPVVDRVYEEAIVRTNGGEVVHFEGSSHFPHFEDPVRFASVASQFFSKPLGLTTGLAPDTGASGAFFA
jgi:pimeloyl-ACP methyl ester carboxylesterase